MINFFFKTNKSSPIRVNVNRSPVRANVNYLRDVNIGSFGAGHDHGLEIVVFRQRFLGRSSRFITGVVQDAIDLILERLTQRVAGRRFQLVVVGLLNDLYHVRFGFLDRVLDVLVRLRIGDRVSDADAVPFVEQPVVDDRLDVAVEAAADLVTQFHEDDVQQGAARGAQRRLAQDAHHQLSVLDDHLRVAGRDPLVRTVVLVVRMRRVLPHHVHLARNDQRKQLFACNYNIQIAFNYEKFGPILTLTYVMTFINQNVDLCQSEI